MDTQVDNFVTLLENYKVNFLCIIDVYSHSSVPDFTVQWPAGYNCWRSID